LLVIGRDFPAKDANEGTPLYLRLKRGWGGKGRLQKRGGKWGKGNDVTQILIKKLERKRALRIYEVGKRRRRKNKKKNKNRVKGRKKLCETRSRTADVWP